MKTKHCNLLKVALIWILFLHLSAPVIGQKHGHDGDDGEQDVNDLTELPPVENIGETSTNGDAPPTEPVEPTDMESTTTDVETMTDAVAEAMTTTTTTVKVSPALYQDIVLRDDQGEIDCIAKKRKFNPMIHDEVYHIVVHATQGFEAAYQQYNKTFAEYLTATAGQRFDPPIRFQMKPVNFQGLFATVEAKETDFFYANPGIYSCVGVETGAQPLVTAVSRLEVRGYTYDLDVYGGVIFARADNHGINGILDLKNKVIGAGSISMIMASQLQFYEMEVAGLSYVMDPKQVVFTENQQSVVQGVIDGEFDVGFVRTDQIERHQNFDGSSLDPDVFKVIEPKIYVLDDGNLFPFLHSTDIYPEWPVAAMKYVPKDVVMEVQEALMALGNHAASQENVLAGRPWAPTRCDTSPELAQLAHQASVDGKLSGFRTARSYFDVRSMHEAAGIILQDEKGDWSCTRAATLYDSIKCPAEHYKLPIDEYEVACSNQGLECRTGYDCYCRPCVKAFEVDVFELTDEVVAAEEAGLSKENFQGCEKMSLCGIVEQTKKITFRIIDNQERDDEFIEVKMHLATSTENLPVIAVGDHKYEIEWSSNIPGVAVMEIFIDGVQIPESPIKVQVESRNCDADFPGERRSSNSNGGCVCRDGTMDVRGKCVESTIIAIIISGLALIFITIIGIFILRYKNYKNDQVWLVNLDELSFDDPVEVIGQGSFGVVILGTYRGTKVALKRAIKASEKRGSRSRSRKGHRKFGSRFGSRSDNSSNMDSCQMDSCGMSSVDDNDQDPEAGENASSANDSNGTGSYQSKESGSRGRSFGSQSAGNSRNQSVSKNEMSLGFLAEDFGGRKKWSWLPWARRNDYHGRFKETILGGGGSSAMSTKSWHAKFCPCFSTDVKKQNEFVHEMRVLARLRHPCITTVLGAVISNSHDPMLVMEYMEYGSLSDILKNETMHLTGEIILQITRDIAQGIRFLHSSKPPILHGDLKGRNILIDSRFRAKLCDFGLSTKKGNLITGTPFWLAPEYLRGQSEYTTQCDIYSIGIVLYEMYAREDPYKGEDFRTTLRKVCDRRINKRPIIPRTCPPKFAELMKKCWSPDPYIRPEAKDLDTALLDMSNQDADHLVEGQQNTTLKERKTGDMLYDLFPKHVADQIKAGKKVEPENHDEVTIIFSDIVHFTDISKSLTPLKVSQMLDRLYLAFDRVAGKHKVFKVETIGDAYLGVTNLEKKQMDCHTKNAALFAIDLVKEASQILIDVEDPSKGHINIRVGFHSGAVVSSVIGSLNPRYSLFGDAISVATRMEENSKANRVLCSEAAYEILQVQAPEITAQKRGKLTIKGKGETKVYWIGGDILATGEDEEAHFLEGSKRVGFSQDESEGDVADQEMWQPIHEPPQSPKPKSRRTVHAQEQAPPSPPPKRSSRRSSTTNNQEATHYRRGK